MEDKKIFGKYIYEKRIKKGLTQEQLANKLCVIPTTISKWERGVTYPDITMITPICKELDISEHEFFIACDDESIRMQEKELKRIRLVKNIFNLSINIGYLIAIIVCLICNIAINHTLSWSLIVLVSIGISFTITTLPKYMQDNKYKALKILFIETILIYLLLFMVNLVNKGSYLIESFIITLFVLSFVWVGVLITTLLNIRTKYKVTINLLLISILTAFCNPVIAYVLKIQIENDNIYNVVFSIILIVIAFIISLKKDIIEK